MTFPRANQTWNTPLSVVRGVVTESAAGTLTELEISMPVDPQLEVGALVRFVWFIIEPGANTTPPAADTFETGRVRASLSTRQGATAIPQINTPGTLGVAQLEREYGSAVADAGISSSIWLQTPHWDYGNAGLLVATRTLSLYVQASGDFLDNASTARVTVAFDLVQVSAQDLLAAISTISDIS